MNQVNLIGYLGRDPELRQAGSSEVCNFNLGSTKRWKDQQGNPKEITQWTDIVCWGGIAKTASQFLKRGSQVLIIGELETQSWDDKESGKKRYKTLVRANKIEFLDSKGQNLPSNEPDLDDLGF